MASQPLKPIVEIESATAADIAGGLESLVGRIRTRGAGLGIVVPAPGNGPDRLMNRALQEVNNSKLSMNQQWIMGETEPARGRHRSRRPRLRK
jgi:hypothetical protein